MANPKLRVDVNHNPTKKGIKVQFVMPETLEGDAKAEMTQKLQAKLNQGLSQYGLTVSQDTDVPYANVIGFLIPIADVKLMIKKAITGSTTSTEEPIAELERMQELAGITNEKPKQWTFQGVIGREIGKEKYLELTIVDKGEDFDVLTPIGDKLTYSKKDKNYPNIRPLEVRVPGYGYATVPNKIADELFNMGI